MMTVTQDQYVTIEYSFSAPDGTLLGSSDYSGPFTFRQGAGDAVPGLDEHVEGHEVGEELAFVISPESGYGHRDETKVHRIAKDALPLDRQPEPGMQVSANGRPMTVTEVTGSEIVLDGNHPLAGIPLHFTVRIIDVSETAPEVDAACGCGGSCSCG